MQNYLGRKLGGLTSAASVLALLAVAAPTFAQTTPEAAAPPADETVVVVTGQRASAASAVNRKKKASEIVDSIVAVDIGKLPDLNVAEALQRISGVQITRNFGEGSSIAIRGLTQVRTELNGRDSFSTTNGRALSFEDIPSEILAGIDIYKNPSAKQIEGGIGGLVNLRTRMPFDSKGQVLSMSAQSTYYDFRKKWGGGASVLYSNRWDTGHGEFGILANLSFTKAYFREDSISVEPFYERTDVPGQIGTPLEVASGGGISTWNGDRDRTGGELAFQWKPNEDLEFYASAIHTQYRFYDPQTGIFAYGAGAGGSLTLLDASDFSFDSQGNLLTGGFGTPPSQTFSRDTIRDSYTTDYSTGFKWHVSQKLLLSADFQYVKSGTKVDDVIGFGSYQNPYNFYLDLTGDVPSMTATPAGYFATAANYYYQASIDERQNNKGDEKAVRADLEWDFDEGTGLKSFVAGIRATSKNIRTADAGYAWNTVSGEDAVNHPEYANLDTFQGDFWRGDGASSLFGPHYVVSPDLMKDHDKALLALGGTGTRAAEGNINVQGEDTQAIYGVLNFAFDNSPLPFDGNVGVRVVQTNVDAEGYQALTYRTTTDTATDLHTSTPLGLEQKYTEVLPSLNVRFLVRDNLFWRVALSKGLSRPDFGQLAANFTLTENYRDDDANPATPMVLFNRTGSGGNPGLKPLTADQFDTALEWYYGSSNLLYVTLFDKEVKNFIQNGIYNASFDVPGKGTQTFEISAPVNGDKGTIKGFEVGVQHFFSALPTPWDGLGVQANYTYVDSKAPSPSATDTNGNPLIVPLEGLSKDSYNLVFLYEKGPLSGRLAYNWRSAYVQTTAGNGTGNLPIYKDAVGQLDGSISYDFNPHWGVSLDFVNILNTVAKSYQAFPDRPRDYVMDDRRIGVRLRANY